MREMGLQGGDPWQARAYERQRQGRPVYAGPCEPPVSCASAQQAVAVGVGFAALRVTYVATWAGFVYVA